MRQINYMVAGKQAAKERETVCFCVCVHEQKKKLHTKCNGGGVGVAVHDGETSNYLETVKAKILPYERLSEGRFTQLFSGMI